MAKRTAPPKRSRLDKHPVFDDTEVEPKTHYRREREPLAAKNQTQAQYISSILTRPITFGIGPAGTGKTYVAASLAAEALDRGDINEIVVTRPMVECGEKMGFLPGEQEEKYAPWIEPVVDVLEERLGKSRTRMFLKNGKIRGSPLMTMRGKTHDNTWVLLDEAQNTTPEQMKMFLTRMGRGAKFIIDGDMSQSDLRDRRGAVILNGLEDALARLRGLPEIGVVEFGTEDIVRHGLVRKILERYG